MGYERYHTIVVSSYSEKLLYEAHKQAEMLFCLRTNNFGDLIAPVTDVVMTPINGVYSFMVSPDGSKEGWDHSDLGDEARAEFVTWLKAQRFSDGSSSLKWVEVQYGDDEWQTKIIHDSDEDLRDHGYEDEGEDHTPSGPYDPPDIFLN